jgi:hypothetical protein
MYTHAQTHIECDTITHIQCNMCTAQFIILASREWQRYPTTSDVYVCVVYYVCIPMRIHSQYVTYELLNALASCERRKQSYKGQCDTCMCTYIHT